MKAEILATGDEIRTGALVDSNSAHIADHLIQSGLVVTRHHTVGDDLDELVAIMTEISGRADMAVVTGGLGPTQDDLTAVAAARAAGCDLYENALALETVERFFRERGRPMSPSNRKQALLPQGATVLDNPVGTAAGFELKIGKCRFFFVPGVPYEMKRMLAEQVLPRIAASLGADRRYSQVQTLSTFGLPESAVGELVSGLPDAFPMIKVGLRAKFPEIQVRLYCDSQDAEEGRKHLAAAADWVVEKVGAPVFSTRDQSMAEAVSELLAQQKVTLSVAESCTGGLICNWLTNVAGASDYFLMGAVTYANSAKIKLLGVRPETLARVGAVDEATAREMAEGVRRAAGADFGLSTTGIAGPSGGSAEKPVGTVCIGLATADRTIARRYTFNFGRRLMNKRIFATAGLNLLRRGLRHDPAL
jgi:nicotinamide-nucleotide amidase